MEKSSEAYGEVVEGAAMVMNGRILYGLLEATNGACERYVGFNSVSLWLHMSCLVTNK